MPPGRTSPGIDVVSSHSSWPSCAKVWCKSFRTTFARGSILYSHFCIAKHSTTCSIRGIDEVGYLSFDDRAADLLYEIVNRRYERKPVILTTNRPFKEWNEMFPNATCIVTLLDRLLHHAGGRNDTVADPAYVAAVLMLYVGLPDTPLRPSPRDQWLAGRLQEQGVSLS